jgi:hypothetical protein
MNEMNSKRELRAHEPLSENLTSEGEFSALSARLPDDFNALMALARSAVDLCDVAVIAGDEGELTKAASIYAAVVSKFAGKGGIGQVSPSSVGAVRLVERHCQAEPGTVPRWGEKGEFVIEVDGIRCLVSCRPGKRLLLDWYFEFRAIDVDTQFISGTGYCLETVSPMSGMPIDRVASSTFSRLLESGRTYLHREHRGLVASQTLPAWVLALRPAPRRDVTEAPARGQEYQRDIPKGFVHVDVMLPSYQAFIVRRWAKAARAQVAAARAAEKEARRGRYSMETIFKPEQRCEIVFEPREALKNRLGKVVIITSVCDATGTVWAHDDKEVTYRRNRKGRKIAYMDPRCIETAYSMEALRPLT